MNLTHKGNFIINNELEVAPKSLMCNFESLASDNSGRTLDGVMHIYWVFNKIRKLEIELKPSTPDYLSQIFGRVQGQEYDITYWDVLENAQKTIHCYTSNGSVDCYSGIVRNGLYQGAKFNAIEIAGELDTSTPIINPYISTSGVLTITTRNTNDTFTRYNNDLLVDVEDTGVSYAIEEGDLMRYEG